MIRIVTADDHTVVRRGLKDIVASEADIEISAKASTAQELLDLGRNHAWDAWFWI